MIHKVLMTYCTCRLPAPTAGMIPSSVAPVLLPEQDEMVVSLHSPFTLTCRGQAKLAWETPIDAPEQTQEDPSGLFVSTITVDSATAMHTGYYGCSYSRNTTEDREDNSKIYIYVPGKEQTKLVRFDHLTLCFGLRVLFCSCTDPDVPFLPSLMPFSNHVLSEFDEMEIQCLVSDPSANVTLINTDTQQLVPSNYDSKRGALGMFTAGTYVCRAVINGEEHYSDQYIVHGWTGLCSCLYRYVR